MEVHQLRYFCAVAETGSFTRAAERENVSQPSLSQQIIKLEAELGTRLFDRAARKARLTPSGEALLSRARAVLQELVDARKQIDEMAGKVSGRVTVGAIPTIGPYFLPARLKRFSKDYPQVHVTVVEEITPVLLEKLRAGELDFGLLALPVQGKDLACRQLLREPLFLVVHERHHTARRQSVELKRLDGEDFLLLKDGHCFRETTISACKKARFEPSIVFESGHFESIVSLVSSGLGISIIPQMAAQPREGCKYLRIREPWAFRPVGLVRLKQHYVTRAMKAFEEELDKTSD